MPKKKPENQSRNSHNSDLMREIILKLQDYDLEELELLCRRYRNRRSTVKVRRES